MELVIVVGIITILAGIAYPSYVDYGFRARRADGKEILMRIASAQERYYTNMNRYATLAEINMASGLSDGQHYTVTIARGNGNQTYTLTATPSGVQGADQCGNLTLTNGGARGFSGAQTNGNCW